jgi:hypothetical protein
MKKQIIETRRLQLLAGMINESQFNEAEEMDEMARTAGTGGAYTITPEGESLLRSLKAGGSLPMGIGINHLEILKFLYNAKKDGKRVQKIDYANLLGKKQPDVNKFFNTVEELGFASRAGYTAGSSMGGTNKATKSVDDILADFEMDDEEI